MSKFDLESGYYQIGVDEKSRKFTAFSCEWGLFEWTRLPMGLKNSGATFQRAMNKLLEKYIGKFCHVYMDDIIIYSRSLKEHMVHLKIICEVIRKAEMLEDLLGAPCCFSMDSVTICDEYVALPMVLQ